MKTRKRFATRFCGCDDGLEYDGEIFPTLAQARRGAREQLKEMREATGQNFDWNIVEWIEEGPWMLGRFGAALEGSDI